MHKIRIALSCYRLILVPASIITLISAQQIWRAHSISFLFAMIWLKLITSALLLLFVFLFRSGQFYFFNNLGFSHVAIYVSLALIDILAMAFCFSIAFFIP